MKQLLVFISFIFLYFYFTKTKFKEAGPFPDPTQIALEQPIILQAPGKFIIKATHIYEITSMIMSSSRYRFDGSSALSPIDFVLAWGPLTLNENLKLVSYSQFGRWYYFFVKNNNLSLDQREIELHSANTHIIPDFSQSSLKNRLLNFKEGDVINFKGYLVTITGNNEFIWNSSLSREDTGGGSCEVFYVVDAKKIR